MKERKLKMYAKLRTNANTKTNIFQTKNKLKTKL